MVSEYSPWSEIENVVKGDTMKSNDGETLEHLKNGQKVNSYSEFKIIQNPRQVQLNQVGAMNVISFDPTRKTVTFQNGVVIGPA
jgi:hypothetical protein